jgi:hypothetical protein
MLHFRSDNPAAELPPERNGRNFSGAGLEQYQDRLGNFVGNRRAGADEADDLFVRQHLRQSSDARVHRPDRLSVCP